MVLQNLKGIMTEEKDEIIQTGPNSFEGKFFFHNALPQKNARRRGKYYCVKCDVSTDCENIRCPTCGQAFH